MGFLLGFIGALIGVLVAIGVVILIILSKVKKVTGELAFKEFLGEAKNVTSYKREEYSRIKDVSGMTKLLEPSIIKDFNDFNKDLIYATVEKNLAKIFNCIENKSVTSIAKDKDLSTILPSLKEKISDLEGLDVEIKYDNLKFHKHAIKDYRRDQGTATITISSSLEYYYICTGKDKEKVLSKNYFPDLKKQTRYITQFAYIYDESKFKGDISIYAEHCPNCGAPVTKVGKCNYCQTYLEEVNLKLWKMSSYKEDIV